jgi:CDP-glycerol glycerophosphotransferase (TagB/SpsB family)
VRDYAPIAVLTSSNAVPHFFPGVKVEVFHGFDAGKPRHIYIRGFFDLYCTTGDGDTRAFKAIAKKMKHFAVRETGWPKLDPFMSEHGHDVLPPLHDPPAILYHSTFSPSWSAAPILHDTIRDLSRSGRWRWIVTLHPKSSAETVAKYRALEGEYLRFATEDNILDLFPQVDMMISDTSSALNEFLLTYKPVVTFRNRRPGPQLIDIDRPDLLLPSIERALARPPELMREVRAYADSIHPYRDGRSSERVLDAVDEFIAHGGRNPRPKPRNWWRKLKIRRRIGYWGRA